MSGHGLKVQCLASTGVEGWDGRGDERKEEEKRDEKELDDLGEGGEEEHASMSLRSSTQKAAEPSAQDPMEDDDPESASSSSESDDETSHSGASSDSQDVEEEEQHVSCMQDTQLSPDGTCFFTSDYSRTFNVYPVDPTTSPDESIRPLKPYASFQSPNPIWAFAANPLFNFQDANTTHVLISRRDSYITLHNALWDISQTSPTSDTSTTPINISTPLSFYKNINPLTEAVTAPLSLTYSHTGTHFFAGLRNSIATFDLSHTTAPIHSIATIPSLRNKRKGGGRGFKGCISALSLSPPASLHNDGLLAAGSRTRYIGIYDATGGTEMTSFALPGTLTGQRKIRNENLAHVMGDGVTSLKWSPCGKYLYVAERCSDVLLIYDVRNFSLSLGYCVGRRAQTKQKLGFDVWNAGASPYDVEAIAHEVWAGGMDGCVRVWRDPYVKEGAVEADEVVRVGGDEMPVVGTLVHASGGLAVVASGRMDIGDGDGLGKGKSRGGGVRPRFREWGRLDILGLG
ncbi:hypothetical protein T440DRAFT_463595 [Plenodomus tracheiphilus IPT5]|uniref:WD40 repeat-like protein n=1 Tax=Plenodomus tracheiphilus IPT5 TaxID=1408161 RepID=A0A6A7BLE6_9PLEO|nr:hypothetical protein T440DRAFT_463595 [Plenodomus tracheiphilus IPT5]